MTSYESLQPGPEMDALVAEKVMGWTQAKPNTNSINEAVHSAWHDQDGNLKGIASELGRQKYSIEGGTIGWSPSTRIEHAWEVIRHMAEQGWHWKLDFDSEMDEPSAETQQGPWIGSPAYRGHRGLSEMPLAICLAALETVE